MTTILEENLDYLDEAEQETVDLFLNESLQSQDQSGMHQTRANNQAAMTAVVAPQGTVQENFSQVKAELEQTGDSVLVNQILDNDMLELREDDRVVQDLLIADPIFTPEEKVGQLEGLQEEISNRGERSIVDVFTDRLIDELPPSTHKTNMIENYGVLNKTRTIIDNIRGQALLKRQEKSGDGTGELFARHALTIATPGFGVRLNRLINEVLPGTSEAKDNILVGESVKRFKIAFKQAPAREKVRLAQGLVDAVDKHTGFLVDDNIQAYEYLQTLLGEVDPTMKEIEVDRWVNDVFGALDIVPVIMGLTRKVIPRFIKDMVGGVKRSSAAGILAEVDRKTANEYFSAAIADSSEEFARSIGTTTDELMESHYLPLVGRDDVGIPMGPDLNDRVRSIMQEDYLGNNTYGRNYTPEEKEAAQAAFREEVSAIDKAAGTTLLSKTKIIPITGGFRSRTAIGRDSEAGWGTLREAKDASEMYLDNTSGADIRFWRGNYETGAYEELGPFEKNAILNREQEIASEYIFTLEAKHVYNPNDVGQYVNDVIGASGKKAKYLDLSTTFNKWIVNGIVVAGDKADAIKSSLRAQLKPLIDLDSDEQAVILNILDDGTRFANADGSTGKWFTNSELLGKVRDKGASNPNKIAWMMRAYRSVQSHERSMLILNNHRLYQKLDNEKFKSISFADRRDPAAIDFEELAKPIRDASKAKIATVAYNPSTKQTDELTSEIIDEIYESGGQLVRFRFPRNIGGREHVNHAIIRKNEGDTIRPLPYNLVKENPGYVTRTYDAAYVVKQRRSIIVDGVEREDFKTISIESNPGDATKARDSLNARAIQDAIDEGRTPPATEDFMFEKSRELRDLDYSSGSSLEYFRDTGQLFFSKRAPKELTTFTGKRVVNSIGDSLDQSINNVSRHLAMDDFIKSSIKRWENTYGREFGNDGLYPFDADITAPRNPANNAAWRDAIAFKDRINMMIGLDPSLLAKSRDAVVRAAEKVVDNGRANSAFWTNVSKAIVKSSGIVELPIQTAKNIAFIRYITLNPVRQLWMQSNTATVMLGVDHGAKYFASKGAFDFTGLMLGQAMDKGSATWKVVAPRAAKAMGMKVEEYEQFLQAFKDTGLSQAISSHQFVSELALDKRIVGSESALFNIPRNLLNHLKGPLRFSREVGFEAGEFANIAAAFLASRNKWIKTYRGSGNPNKLWLQKDNLDQISGSARSLAFNMNQVGATSFQKGGLGLIFQFGSHAHKSMQAILPDTWFTHAVAGKALSNQEKARIATTQVLLYGTASMGIFSDGAFEFIRDSLGIEMTPEQTEVIEEGLIGEALNAALRLSDEEGESSSVVFTEDVSPFGAGQSVPAIKIIKSMYDVARSGALGAEDLLTPPGIKATSEVFQTLQHMNWLHGNDLPPFPVNDFSRTQALIEEGIKLAPIIGNSFKWRFYDRTGAISNRLNDPIARATVNEMIAKSLIGSKSRDERDVNEIQFKLMANGFSQKNAGIDADVNTAARAMYNHIKKVVREADVEAEIVDDKWWKEAFRDKWMILSEVYQPGEFVAIVEKFHDIALNDKLQVSEGEATATRKEALKEMISTKLNRSKLFSNYRLASKIRNSGLFEEDAEFEKILLGNPADHEAYQKQAQEILK